MRFMFCVYCALVSTLAHPVDIYHLTSETYGQDPQLVALAREAAWSWSQRTGIEMHFAGDRSDGAHLPGTIGVRRATKEEWASQGRSANGQAAYTTRWDYTAGTYMQITFGPNAGSLPLMKHEMGHTLGYFTHSDSFRSIMYTFAWEPLITIEDVDLIRQTTIWPITAAASLCHVEFDAWYHVYIPYINGFSATLLSRDGGATFELRNLSKSPAPKCAGRSRMDETGQVTLSDVRSYQASLSAVVMVPSGKDRWRVVSAVE